MVFIYLLQFISGFFRANIEAEEIIFLEDENAKKKPIIKENLDINFQKNDEKPE